MQDLIELLITSIEKDKLAIAELEEKANSLKLDGINGLSDETLDKLYSAVMYLRKVVETTRRMIIDLSLKYHVNVEVEGRL